MIDTPGLFSEQLDTWLMKVSDAWCGGGFSSLPGC